ncbi:MAG: choice-of-anchor D domain-containing protein [Methylomicrobium sp.]
MAVLIAMTNVGVEPTQAAVEPAQIGSGFTVTAADLAFILQQIKIAEYHAANTTSQTGLCGALVGNRPNQIPSPLLSLGLRTVDGTCNNLQNGQETFGASDEAFPRLATPNFNRLVESPPAGFPPGPAGPDAPRTNYNQTDGFVYDSEPRTISNLIVDQTSTNPAAVSVAGNPFRTQADPDRVVPCDRDPITGADLATPEGCVPQYQTLFIPNITTDVGLSPPYNSLFTIFGQFFDHGLDKITNGGNGSVFVPLKDDDPLVAGPDHILVDNPLTVCTIPPSSDDPNGSPNGCDESADNIPPHLRFIPLTRGTIMNGPDGFRSAPNTDTPFVDQSQTYTSHSSHQVFTREYVLNAAGRPVATGRFLEQVDGGLPTWKMVKDQAAARLGLQLTDADVTNIPMIAADQYGNFIPGPVRGLPQYVTTNVSGAIILVEGNLVGGGLPVPANVVRIDTAFLNDIAHSAAPTAGGPDADDVAGGSLDTPQLPGTYDNELLDLHFICGDGRCNENIALSAVHQIFHAEHNRLIDYFINPTDGVLTRPENAALWADFQDVNPSSGNPATKTFTYQERLFQAARFVTEMQYQHLVFEEFARKVQPAINPFQPFAFNQTDLNSAIKAEFAHAVYRFGHSMLTDTIPRLNAPESVALGAPLHNDIPLFDGFLNPAAYNDGGPIDPLDPEGPHVRINSKLAAGSILMGLSDQTGNEIDEFVADTLRNRLLGLPQDLPSINMARARSEGVPTLNNFRKQVFAKTNDGQLAPYKHWIAFDQALKHHESLINFVAAYGKHPTIRDSGPDGLIGSDCGTPTASPECADNNTTLAGKRAAAKLIVEPGLGEVPPPDAGDFMFSTGAWATGSDGVSKTGVDDIDLWMGGLAENTNLFGGLLGPTFNYVFEKQLTDLQNGDRLYYLARTPGMNLRSQLEGNSFAELVMRNTPAHTLKADPFATADCKFERANLTSPAIQPTIDPVTLLPSNLNEIFGPGSVNDDPASECNENLLLLMEPDGTIRYRAINSVDPAGINGQSVYNGTSSADRFYGGNDNDTFWGGLGNDIIDGGAGDDVVLGGEGNDIITDFGGADFLKGGPGNDAIDGGIGDDIIIGGDGKDFINGGGNINETFAGPGDDFVIAGQGEDAVFGDGGNDWEEGGDMPDLLIGDSSTLFFNDFNRPGHDILIGQGGDDDYDMEGGDDIGVAGPGVEKVAGAAGYDWEIGLGDPQPQNADLSLLIVNTPPLNETRDRYNEIEALSGWKFNDILRGDSVIPSQVGGGGFIGCDALDAAGVARITNLNQLVTPAMRTVDAQAVIDRSVTNYCELTGLVWGEGNILIGGEGSDQLEGRGGNDILDGDRYLNVRLSVLTQGIEIGSTDLMENKAVIGSFGPNTTPDMTLQQAVFAGLVDPGNIVAVREILTPTVPAPDCGAATPLNCDTALFSKPQVNYSITLNADGSVTVTDTNGGGGGGGVTADDGTDILWNIEQISFCEEPDPLLKDTCAVRAAPIPTAGLSVPVAAVSLNPTDFGGQIVGTTSERTITVTNTGATNLLVSEVTLTGTDAGQFSITSNNCTTVTPSSFCFVTVGFTPTSTGAKTATVSIASNAAGSPSSVTLSGNGLAPAPIAAINPASVGFGDVVIGTTSGDQAITVNNNGTQDLIVSGVSLSGLDADVAQFSLTNGCATVAPGASCTVNVRFAPTTTGPKTVSVNFVHNDNRLDAPSSVTVTGTGAFAGTTAAINNASWGGGVRINTSVTKSVKVTNTGISPLVITSASVADEPAFVAALGTCTAAVASGRTCNLSVTFTPTAARVYTGTLRMVSNASNNPSGTLTATGRVR